MADRERLARLLEAEALEDLLRLCSAYSMPTHPSTDEVIDAFVARMNGSPRPVSPAEEVPVSLRLSDVDDHGQVEWAIRQVPFVPWIEALEARLPRPFPPSFRSLVTRYTFPSFDLGPLHLFANTGEADQDEELASRIFRDKVMAKVLLGSGFLQVGWPTGIWYDPVCFDLNARRVGGEYPLVQLDHEATLQRLEVRVLQSMAASFLDLARGH